MLALFALSVVLVAQSSGTPAAKIEELEVSSIDQTITLRADGTGELRSRGKPDQFNFDERVGFFTGRFDAKLFQRIALILRDVKIEELKDHRLAFPTSFIHITIKHDGKSKTVEIHDRRVATDPDPPDRLWNLAMIVKGFATTVTWEPITTGVRVHFKSGGPIFRYIVVRDAESRIPVVSIHSRKEMVDFPIKPGKYSVEYQVELAGTVSDAVKTKVTVEEGKFHDVIIEK
jgi:hypothetical protein